ncbi:DUF2894 domain-containing protein [Scleromatobacter humisilvae]|uniref:DUF2894 domain-containing protein n=1 Tax=Scleromatobacter humisilvae TaxID=2897159 RepID=A0A9X1YK98_9BURK|nr:DUF2894 domain-containing protein [Scleromatobacter humisilvae]MCK9686955.1 DUF2894 domain-containing protein [Scleromatobacter humisilvae]
MAETPSFPAAVRARLAQALARRADAHAGEARRMLDQRVAALAATALASQDERAAQEPSRRGALAELVAHAARQKAAPVLDSATRPRESSPEKAAATDTRTLQFFQRTWSRLSAGQRLAQARATLPENAGPLNSHHLVHRSLTLMHALSPEYLERFVGYIDALQWLEQANEAEAQELRPAAAKKSMPARR